MKTDEIKQRVAAIRAEAFVKGSPMCSWDECRKYTEGIDAIVKDFADFIFGKRGETAIIATGGYGRREMSPKSDCDIRIILGGNSTLEASDSFMKLLRSFWDSGVKLTFSMGSVAETASVALGNFRTLTSLLDSRLVWGEGALHEETMARINESVNSSLLKGFYDFIQLEAVRRYKMYGNSTSLVQPNIKLSPGGLRDYNSIRWFARLFHKCDEIEGLPERGILSEAIVNRLIAAAGNLLKIRNMLHLTTEYKSDQLAFDLQLDVARAVGFDTKDELEDIENLMRLYYASTREISLHFSILSKRAEIAIRKTEKRFANLCPPEARDWEGFMEATTYAAENNLELHPEVEIAAIEMLDMRCALRMTAGIRRHFYRILLSREDRSEILMRLLELGILVKLVPQLRDIENLYRRDLYHFFTVDVHALRGVYFLKRLEDAGAAGDFALARKILSALTNAERKMLFLALLFHDAGKGRGGSDHSERGAALISDAKEILMLTAEETELITFLVKNHLLLSNASRTRDIYEVRVINEIAGTVENREKLDLLYLLTIADMSSVAPHGSTDWSRTLLDALYGNLLKKIEEGASICEDISAVIEEKRRAFERFIREKLETSFTEEDAERYFALLPSRYFLYAAPATIHEHFTLLKRAESEKAAVSVREISQDYYEIVIVAKDSPGLLYRFTGVFLLNALTIMEARIYSGKEGVILDVFRVRDISGNCLSVESKRRDFIESMKSAAENFDVIERVRKRFSTFLKGIRSRQNILRGKVRVDNSVSDNFTVVTVKCADRVGLLHSLTEVFYTEGMSISLAIIITEGSLAVDTFYVEMIGGGKVLEHEAIERLKNRLLEAT